ncbi:hypothetical protein GQ53DRAFT_409006 [Thozetella sp. PMI_491]|nr:hypothetical protein GQ53DRAFT_409006 [Thozetella sp. PMI_491]
MAIALRFGIACERFFAEHTGQQFQNIIGTGIGCRDHTLDRPGAVLDEPFTWWDKEIRNPRKLGAGTHRVAGPGEKVDCRWAQQVSSRGPDYRKQECPVSFVTCWDLHWRFMPPPCPSCSRVGGRPRSSDTMGGTAAQLQACLLLNPSSWPPSFSLLMAAVFGAQPGTCHPPPRARLRVPELFCVHGQLEPPKQPLAKPEKRGRGPPSSPPTPPPGTQKKRPNRAPHREAPARWERQLVRRYFWQLARLGFRPGPGLPPGSPSIILSSSGLPNKPWNHPKCFHGSWIEESGGRRC